MQTGILIIILGFIVDNYIYKLYERRNKVFYTNKRGEIDYQPIIWIIETPKGKYITSVLSKFQALKYIIQSGKVLTYRCKII